MAFIKHDLKHIAPNLRRVRNSLGWTQEHLARKAQVSVRTIRRLEYGREPRADTFLRVAWALGGIGMADKLARPWVD
jgi:predicted transcriptional regulator